MGIGIQPSCCGQASLPSGILLRYEMYWSMKWTGISGPPNYSDIDLYTRVRDKARTVGFIAEYSVQPGVRIDDDEQFVEWDTSAVQTGPSGGISSRLFDKPGTIHGIGRRVYDSERAFPCWNPDVEFNPIGGVDDTGPYQIPLNPIFDSWDGQFEAYRFCGFSKPHRFNFWRSVFARSGDPITIDNESIYIVNLVAFRDPIDAATENAFTLRVDLHSAFDSSPTTYLLSPQAPNATGAYYYLRSYPEYGSMLSEDVGFSLGAHAYTDESFRAYIWYPYFQELPGPDNSFPPNIDTKCGHPLYPT